VRSPASCAASRKSYTGPSHVRTLLSRFECARRSQRSHLGGHSYYLCVTVRVPSMQAAATSPAITSHKGENNHQPRVPHKSQVF
jgi:hypothetical protein